MLTINKQFIGKLVFVFFILFCIYFIFYDQETFSLLATKEEGMPIEFMYDVVEEKVDLFRKDKDKDAKRIKKKEKHIIVIESLVDEKIYKIKAINYDKILAMTEESSPLLDLYVPYLKWNSQGKKTVELTKMIKVKHFKNKPPDKLIDIKTNVKFLCINPENLNSNDDIKLYLGTNNELVFDNDKSGENMKVVGFYPSADMLAKHKYTKKVGNDFYEITRVIPSTTTPKKRFSCTKTDKTGILSCETSVGTTYEEKETNLDQHIYRTCEYSDGSDRTFEFKYSLKPKVEQIIKYDKIIVLGVMYIGLDDKQNIILLNQKLNSI